METAKLTLNAERVRELHNLALHQEIHLPIWTGAGSNQILQPLDDGWDLGLLAGISATLGWFATGPN